jgi:hypothetical protein
MATDAKTEVRQPPEVRFLANVTELCRVTRDIIEEAEKAGVKVPVQTYVIDLATGFVSKKKPAEVINTFLIRSYNHWDRVKARDANFFKSATKTLFEGVSEENIAAFIALYDAVKPDGTKIIDKDREDQYFDFFTAMIKQCICYIHQERKLDPVTKKYTVSAYSSIGESGPIRISVLAAEWKVTRLD